MVGMMTGLIVTVFLERAIFVPVSSYLEGCSGDAEDFLDGRLGRSHGCVHVTRQVELSQVRARLGCTQRGLSVAERIRDCLCRADID